MDTLLILPPLSFYFDIVEQITEDDVSTIWSVISKDGRLFSCRIYNQDSDKDVVTNLSLMAGKVSKYPNKSPFLTFYGSYSHNDLRADIYEISEWGKLTNLVDSIYKKSVGIPSEQQLLNLTKAILQQIAYLNAIGLPHGNICPESIVSDGRRFILVDVIPQPYNPKYPVHVHAEVSRTSIEFWNKGVGLGVAPTVLLWKKDIFDLGEMLMDLTGCQPIPFGWFANPTKLTVLSGYSKLDIVINTMIEVDITERPLASELLKLIESLL